MTTVESLVGRDILFVIREPHHLAARDGDPTRRGRALRATHLPDGTTFLWIRVEVPLEVEGVAATEIGLQARHLEMSLEDLFKGLRVMANAYLATEDGLHFFATFELRGLDGTHRK